VVTLQELIAESDLHPAPRIGEFTRLATGAQRYRHEQKASRATSIPRTTGLWCVLELDPGLAGALAACGLDKDRLAETLSFGTAPPAAKVQVAELHEDFERALRTYLAGRVHRGPVDLADLALAILRAGRDDTRGRLPERLSRLGVDVGAAIAAVEALIEPPEGEEPYSRSVREARGRLEGAGPITASVLAAELQRAHPDYAGGGFGSVTLRDDGTEATADEWLARVAALYDLDEVATTRHEVIDGPLTILGLAALDEVLAAELRSAGVLDAFEHDAAARPRPARPREREARTDWTTDSPATEDLLGRKVLAEILAKKLRCLSDPQADQLSSFMVHVDGPWGAGKSTLFEFLQKKLEPGFVVVRVNAWRDQRTGAPWWTLLSALRRAVVLSRPRSLRAGARVLSFFDRLRAGWLPFVVALLALVAALVALVAATHIDLNEGGKVADSVLKLISLTTVGLAAIAAATRFLLPATKRSAELLVQTRDDPMDEVMRLFARSLRRAKRPTVFLIDDLDRCDGSYVVEFLEAMQTLVRDAPARLRGRRRGHEVAGPYAFIAADGQWIRTAYEAHYDTFGASASAGRPLGFLFLEKVFQIHVRLPTITDSARERFMRTLLKLGAPATEGDDEKADQARREVAAAGNDAAGVEAARGATTIDDPVKRMEVLGEAAVKFADGAVVDATEHELARFGVFLEPNPRSMRLFVNTYSVLRSLRTLEEVFVPLGPLALWSVVEVRWPYLADHLRAHPEAVDSGNGAAPPVVAALLRNAEVRRVLDDEENGPLDRARIRECAGVPAQMD
jgi:KAP family P-loop domain